MGTEGCWMRCHDFWPPTLPTTKCHTPEHLHLQQNRSQNLKCGRKTSSNCSNVQQIVFCVCNQLHVGRSFSISHWSRKQDASIQPLQAAISRTVCSEGKRKNSDTRKHENTDRQCDVLYCKYCSHYKTHFLCE